MSSNRRSKTELTQVLNISVEQIFEIETIIKIEYICCICLNCCIYGIYIYGVIHTTWQHVVYFY